MKGLTGAAIVAGFMWSATSAAAVTINIFDGGVGCESAGRFVDNSACLGTGTADLAQSLASGDTVTFEGAGTLFGWIKDAASSGSSFIDAAFITLVEPSEVTFTLSDIDPGFDGSLTFGPASPTIVDAFSGPLSFELDAGTYEFIFDAAAPDTVGFSTTTEYELSVAPTLAAVPLAASGLLLLGALGFLGLWRRFAD
ncbi:MAG: hypothetical protein AAGA15_08905 [Pseudomonadota bacterium]